MDLQVNVTVKDVRIGQHGSNCIILKDVACATSSTKKYHVAKFLLKTKSVFCDVLGI